AETEGHGQPCRRQAERFPGIGCHRPPIRRLVGVVTLRLSVTSASDHDRLQPALERLGRLAGGHAGGSGGPRVQELYQVVPLGRDEIEGGDVGMALGRSHDAALMLAPEGLALLPALCVRCAWLRGLRQGLPRGTRPEARACGSYETRARGEKAATGSAQLAVGSPAHRVASTKVLTSSST